MRYRASKCGEGREATLIRLGMRNEEERDLITRVDFCQKLREQLLANKEKTLLRIVVAPVFDRPREFTGRTILEQGEQLACALVVPKRRAVVLLLLPHCPELFLLQLGLVLRGHIPAILPWPTSRVDPAKYQRNLAHQLNHLPADQLITSPRLARNLAASVDFAVTGMHLVKEEAVEKFFSNEPVTSQLEQRKTPAPNSRPKPGPDALFLQFSGGTTGAQKAIVVTAEMLWQQLRQLKEALAFTSDDGVVSWLPLYHDMGLIACYWMPLWHGATSVQVAATDWVMNPELLLKYISRYRPTFCWLPNFSFSYLSQRREFMRRDYQLDSIRAWINCSEPVRIKSVNEFLRAFADWGVRQDSIQACYAMAETVFAVTQSQLGKPLSTIQRSFVNKGNQAHAGLAFEFSDDDYVSSGRPISNTDVKVVTADGSICPQGTAGEILVHTPSLFSGYWGSEGFQAHSLSNGWHATGDYGFLSNGELFVIGRFKDIVIVGGNNIFPEDVEAIVNNVDGVHPGRVAAFGVEDKDFGTQSLAIVAEMKDEFNEEAASELESIIRKLVLTTTGTVARHVAVVPARWIVKSTAGKISRRETRQRFLQERLPTT
jgi:fatty-acyl-CoA synthase